MRPTRVLHLAAQAGVRYSIDQPDDYTDSNLLGFGNILQGCRAQQVAHLVFASSSSVYGGNARLPFSERDAVDHPISYYAATKKANEVMAHSYAHLYGLPTTGPAFFTVYGPWGRPDMALFKFTRAMLAGETIDVYGQGQLVRDFTYIDDIVEGVLRVLDKPATPDPAFNPQAPHPGRGQAPYRVFNIGNNQPTVLMDYIAAIEAALGVQASKRLLPVQPGDMTATAADTRALAEWVGFAPNTAGERRGGPLCTVVQGVLSQHESHRLWHRLCGPCARGCTGRCGPRGAVRGRGRSQGAGFARRAHSHL